MQATALLGPSGSGKTTLMDVLSNRKTVGKIEGEIRFGGRVPTKKMLRRLCGYVEQVHRHAGESGSRTEARAQTGRCMST
eukprot:2395446-Pleurochrysis_carterae.AAC.2